jgi:hypothetical protein
MLKPPIVAMLCVLAVGCSKEASPGSTRASPSASAASAVSASAARAPDPAVAIANAKTLSAALKLAKPLMDDRWDSRKDPRSKGMIGLARWAAKKLTWAELAALPETDAALVLKDSEVERGKRLCARGEITLIRRSRRVHQGMFWGTMYNEKRDTISFIAAGSTGNLVRESKAHYCGIVVGLWTYANNQGGQTISIETVGMFDLPENRKPPAAK